MLEGRFQEASNTGYDRYPPIWRRAAAILKRTHPRVLSFGCSTGEECYTILAYFPGATVFGVEHAKIPLRMARLRHSHPNITYFSPSEIRGLSDFDLVCANSVLCHHPANANAQVNDLMPFEDFDGAVADLCSRIKSGGVLMLHNAEYRFKDTKASKGFRADRGMTEQSVSVFEADGRRSKHRMSHVLWIKS